MPVERVAFLSSEYPPHVYGGLGTTVEALSRYIAAEGVEVVVFVPDVGSSAAPPPGVELQALPVENALSDQDFWLTYSEAALAALPDVDPGFDVVHCHDWMTALGGLAARRVMGTPVVMTVHLPQAAPSNLVMENLGLAACDGVVVNSEAVRAELSGRGVRCGEISEIANGVDLARFSPLEVATEPQQVLFVGRLVPQKAVDVLIRAFGAVLRRHPRASLVIAGDGQQGLYLERLARFLGVRDHVHFLGWQSPDDLAELYRTSAVTAVPSLYEPFGLVALEAMASGRPVVVARSGGLAQIVEDQVSGFTVEPGDHLGLASRLATLLTDQELAHRMGLSARRRAEQFDWATTARRTIELYQSVVARALPPPLAPVDPDALDELLEPADDDLRERASALLGLATTPVKGRHGR